MLREYLASDTDVDVIAFELEAPGSRQPRRGGSRFATRLPIVDMNRPGFPGEPPNNPGRFTARDPRDVDSAAALQRRSVTLTYRARVPRRGCPDRHRPVPCTLLRGQCCRRRSRRRGVSLRSREDEVVVTARDRRQSEQEQGEDDGAARTHRTDSSKPRATGGKVAIELAELERARSRGARFRRPCPVFLPEANCSLPDSA